MVIMIADVHQRRTLYISQLNSLTAAGGGANMLHLNLPLHARRAACTLQLHLVITRPGQGEILRTNAKPKYKHPQKTS